jgi:hypothetical protein
MFLLAVLSLPILNARETTCKLYKAPPSGPLDDSVGVIRWDAAGGEFKCVSRKQAATIDFADAQPAYRGDGPNGGNGWGSFRSAEDRAHFCGTVYANLRRLCPPAGKSAATRAAAQACVMRAQTVQNACLARPGVGPTPTESGAPAAQTDPKTCQTTYNAAVTVCQSRKESAILSPDSPSNDHCLEEAVAERDACLAASK